MIRTVLFSGNGGSRTFYSVNATVTAITLVRNWRNLWLKKNQQFTLEIAEVPIGDFKNASQKKIEFPAKIKITDITGDLKKMKISDTVKLEIGYADPDQQYFFRVKAFSLSLEGFYLE